MSAPLMGAGSWEPPLVRVDGARDRPLLLDDAWAAPTALGAVAPVEIAEPDGTPGPAASELEFLEAAAVDPGRRRQILAAGLLSFGLRLLAVAVHRDPPSPELVGETWDVLVRWLDGESLGDRADEATLRARTALDLLDGGGSGQEVRLAAGVLLDLPEGHPLRDEAAARRGLLRHLRSQRVQPEPVWELLALERLVTGRLVGHRTVLRYLRRALELRDRVDDPELRHRVLVVVAGYHLERAVDETLPPVTRLRAAGQAVASAERLVTDEGQADQDDRLLLAAAYGAAGREREAAAAFGAGLDGRGPGESEAVWRASLRQGQLLAELDDPVAAVDRLAAVLPEIEREYLVASGDERLSDIGGVYSDAASTLAWCQLRTGAVEDAFTSLERSKSLRARHRAALHRSPAGRRFLELERTLLAWQRGASVRFTSRLAVDSGSSPDSVVLSPDVAARLPADDRIHQLRRELARTVPDTVPAPPLVADWAGRLGDGEAVVSLGVGEHGTWWGAVTAASARAGRLAAHDLRTDWPGERWAAVVTEPEADSWLVALLTRRGADLRRTLAELLVAAGDFLAPMARRLSELGIRRLRLVPHRWLRVVPFWAVPALAPFRISVEASAVPPGTSAGWAAQEVAAVADPTGDLWTAAAEPEIVRDHLGPLGFTVRALVRGAAVKADILAAAGTADVLHFAGHGRTDLADPERSALWLHNAAAARAARAGEDPLATAARSITRGWRETRPGLREVVVAGAGLLAEYDAGDGVLEHRLEHPLGATLWSRGSRTAELWTAEEITVGESLPRCRLAVLTACEAAGGGLSAVDEATGLPAALIAAGVSTVVASLWPVDDDLAVLFTDRFYRELAAALGRPGDVDVAGLAAGVRGQLRSMTATGAAEALGALIDRTGDAPARARLRAARIRRAAGPKRPFGDPLHWAAFGVFGTGLLEREG